MEIQRISFHMGPFDSITAYKRKRISLMGSHIERLLFYYGLNQFNIPNCNFIHLTVHDEELETDLKLPTGIGYDKMANLSLVLHTDVLFQTHLKDQPKFLLDLVYNGIKKFLEFNDLSSEILTETYQNILSHDFFLPGQKVSNNKQIPALASLLELCVYDSYIYKLRIEKDQTDQLYPICTISPIFIPAEHPGELPDNYIRFPTKGSWIDDNTFKVTCGHKEFSFSLDKMRVETIEHEELKNKYINWDSVN